jgi:predicted amidohydrolase
MTESKASTSKASGKAPLRLSVFQVGFLVLPNDADSRSPKIVLQGGPKFLDKKVALAMMTEQVTKAATAKSDLIVFPELYLTGYVDGHMFLDTDGAESATGPSFQEVSKLAAQHKIGICYGYPERSVDEDGVAVIYNRCSLHECAIV